MSDKFSPLKLALRSFKEESKSAPAKEPDRDYLEVAMRDFQNAKTDAQKAAAFRAAIRLANKQKEVD